MNNYKVNNKLKILTPSGFKNFSGIRKIDKNKYFLIIFEDNTSIKCSYTHRFISDKEIIYANNIKSGDVIDGKNENKKVKSIELINDNIELFDIFNVSDGNIFYSNDIVSHNCDFTTSGHTVIDADVLKWYHDLIKDPIEKRGHDKSYWLWEYPDYTKNYILCADVARGDGGDKSAFHIFEIETLSQVAEYKGVIDTKSYGNMLVAAAAEFNNAILIVENNNIGWASLQEIIDKHYVNTFYSSADLTYVDVEQQMTGKLNRQEKKMIPGFTTTHRTRPLIVSKLESYFREKSFGLRSVRLWEELSVFIWAGAKAEAMTGYNDDLVTSLGIGLWVRDTSMRLNTQCVDLNRSLLHSIKRVGNHDIIYNNTRIHAQKSWQTSYNKEQIDLKWLL